VLQNAVKFSTTQEYLFKNDALQRRTKYLVTLQNLFSNIAKSLAKYHKYATKNYTL
jgi:hypothetical protein